MTPFVGRDAEVEHLLDNWEQAKAGEGRIVLISGEPGIGKSRLVRTLQERLAGESHTRLPYQCSPFHTNSSLYPFIQQLGRAAGFQPEDESARKLDKLEAILAMGTSRVAAIAPLLANLLSIPFDGRYAALDLSPGQQRRQTLAALLDQLEGLARKQPVLQIFEDVQWIDATSRELTDLAIERIRQLPVLMLITFRPEFEAPWVGLPNITTLTLGRLDREHVREMAQQVIGGQSLPAETIEQIAAKTDGVPLFVEELTKSILETFAAGRADDSPRAFAIPTTLQDSLMARLDRLEGAKGIAQTAAAIGREFSYSLLASVVGQNGMALQSPLAQLEQAQLVFRKGEPPEAAYAFKHALLQDAAYQSLPKNRRRGLHRRIAETVRDRFPAMAETQPEVVAQHFTEAGLTEDAVTWWGKAGTFALRHSAFVEAIAHLEKALELADNLTQGSAECLLRLRLQLSYGEALQAARGYGAPETAAAFDRARKLAEISQDPEAKFLAISGLWAGSWVRSELAPMRRWAEALRRDGERQAAAGGMCGLTSWFEGNFVGAREQFERALAAHNVGASSKSSLKSYLAVVLWPLGEVADARLAADDAIVHATRSQQVLTIANAHAFTGRYEMTRCDPHRALQHAEPLVTLSHEHDLRFFLPVGMFTLGWAHWHGGEREPGMAEMCEGIELARKEGIFYTIPAYVTFLAEAKSRAGQADIGLAMLDEVFAQIDRTKQRVIEAEIHRIRGQILLRRAPADHAAAEASFIRAIEIARNQQTKSYELRATLALAKLYHATGRDKLVPELLIPAVGHFANGIELPELEEAHRLLASISEQPSGPGTSRGTPFSAVGRLGG